MTRDELLRALLVERFTPRPRAAAERYGDIDDLTGIRNRRLLEAALTDEPKEASA